MTRKEISLEDLIGGVATFNADPFAIDDEELAKEVMECIDDYGFEAITDGEERDTARAQLYLNDDDVTIYRCGNACKFVLP